MADERKLRAQYKSLAHQLDTQIEPAPGLAKAMYHLMQEMNAVDEEIELICQRAFFPYHDIPLFDLLTNERYHQGSPPGTCPPD